MTLSIAAGPTGTPLLEQTIGANLEATVDRFPDRGGSRGGASGDSADLGRV